MDEPPQLDCAWATVGRGKGGEYAWYDVEIAIERAPGKYLPHLRQPGAIYFVTFRTADSIPAPVIAQWTRERQKWLSTHPEPHDDAIRREYHRRFTERMHRFLDECHGACPFRDRCARDVVEAALLFRDGSDYALDQYVIMPNHVHVLVSPTGANELSDISGTWKRVSAHRLNKLLGRRGEFWQQENWDHVVRKPEYLERFQEYIAENPKCLPRA
jgi:REP element-mobilizing transposase RayT